MTIKPESPEPVSLAKPVRLLRQANHDLRNPLNALLATANMLSEGIYEPLTAGQLRAVQRMERSAHRMVWLLDDLITYVKAEAGELELASGEYDPRRLLDTIKTECQATAEAKDITLSVGTAESVPPTFSGDESAIRHIIIALTWNAISFTPYGTVQIGSEWCGGWLVTVKDAGPGIPPTELPRLFEPFWRGKGGGSPVPTSGSGLGLATARAVAKLMRGQLSLAENGPRGCIFTLHLPI